MTISQAKRKLKKISDQLEDIGEVLDEISEEFSDDGLTYILNEIADKISLITDDDDNSIPHALNYFEEEIENKNDDE